MRCFLWIIVLLTALRSTGAVTESISSLSITNGSDYLIAADALSNAPGTEREAIQVRAVVRWTNDTAFTDPHSTAYELRIRSGGSTVNIFTEAGVPGTVYRFTNSVSVPGTAAGGTIARTNVFSLKPAAPLNPFENYSAQLTLVSGVMKMDTEETTERQFWHFTNLVSGDAAFNVMGALETNGWEKTYAIETVPGQESFQITNLFRLVRYDEFNGASVATNIPVRFSWQLQDTNGVVIPTVPASTNFTVSLLNFVEGTPNQPRDRTFSRAISFQSRDQLNSVSNRYRVVVTLSLTNNPGQPAVVVNTSSTPLTRLLHYNGNLIFGNVSATLTNLVGEPAALFTLPFFDYLNTELDGRAAFLESDPVRSFNLSGPRTFRLQSNGDAVWASGTITLSPPLFGDYFTNNNFRIRRAGVTLSTSGASTDLRFYLPAGFGLTTNYSATRILESQFTFQDVGLNDALEARTNIFFDGNFVASTESKPVLILGERLTWSASLQRFTITPNSSTGAFGTRTFDQAVLQARSNLLASPNLGVKRANDAYYQHINGFTGSIILTAAANGIAQLNYTATFSTNGSFAPHFPAGPIVTWTNGGTIQISANSVVPGANSRFEGVQGLTQRYIGSCVGCDDLPTTNSLSMTVSNRVLNVTRDGGLIATREGGIGLVQNLTWGLSETTGAYAHRANAVSDLTFHMPGHFLRGTDNTASDEDAPGVLHLTGVAATNLSVIERPLTSGYDAVGRADYAGINIRSSPAGSSVGRDTITGVAVNFDRTARSKYYIRFAGVSGIHEAVPNSFANSLTLLGYPFTFDKYGFSFLDSQNAASRTDGSVSVPYPANTKFPFKEIRLTCPGGLESAQLPAGTDYRYLDYWRADIKPQSIRFQGLPGAECDPTKSYLVIGAQAHASHSAEPLAGTLGFFPNGSIIPPSFDLPGVESRFELPSQFRFAGPPGAGDWVMTPVSPAYFTTNDVANAPSGYLNFAGKLSAPFFQNIKVHLHTGARTNGAPGTAEIALAGGWPRAGEGNLHGWAVSEKHYFNDANFDENNRGFPTGINITNYQSSSGDLYRARAERTWLEVVDFNYPLTWDPALRIFRSKGTVTSPLLLVTAQHQLTHLDPKQAVLDIGPRYDGLPVVTLAHLLVDENGAGAATAMRNAIGQSAYNDITNGLATADHLLSENPTRLIHSLMSAGVDPVIDNLVNDLIVKWNLVKTNTPNVRASFGATAVISANNHFLGGGSVSDTIKNRLLYLGVPGLGGQLFPTLSSSLSGIATGMNRNANSFDGGAVGAEAIRQLVSLSAPQFSSSLTGPEVAALLAQNSSAFGQLSTLMLNAKASIAVHTNGLAAMNSEWAEELKNLWNDNALELRTMATNARNAVISELASYNYRVDDPFAGNGVNEIRARIRNAISDRLLGQPVIASVRTSVKQRVFDLNANYRSAANSVFAQYNFVARELISRSLAQVDNNFAPGLGFLNEIFALSRLQGHAEIVDDSLRELRLDGRVKLKVPEEMMFNAFLEIKEMNSGNTPEGCLPGGGVATEIKFGATDVELDWISDDLRADVTTKITMVDGDPSGFAGSFQTRGPLEFGGFVVKQIGFALAFGEEENYLAANARVKMGQSAEIAGGLFFGRACELQPLTLAVISVSPYLLSAVNPQEIFGEPPFTGAFVYGEGTFPVWSVGCLFEVRLTAGAGAWYFKEGPKYGGIVKAGVGGTALCVLSVSGDITLIGAKHADGMLFAGLAHVEGCFGFWPFEICVDADTHVKYYEGKEWDADEP